MIIIFQSVIWVSDTLTMTEVNKIQELRRRKKKHKKIRWKKFKSRLNEILSKMSPQPLPWISMKFKTDIHIPLEMNCITLVMFYVKKLNLSNNVV